MCHIGTLSPRLPRFVLRAVLVRIDHIVYDFVGAPVIDSLLVHQVNTGVVLLNNLLKRLELKLCVLQARLGRSPCVRNGGIIHILRVVHPALHGRFYLRSYRL